MSTDTDLENLLKLLEELANLIAKMDEEELENFIQESLTNGTD